MPTLTQIVTAHKVRKAFGTGDKKRDADQKTPDDVIRFDNIRYGDARRFKKWQLLDVYRPKDKVLNDDDTPTEKNAFGKSNELNVLKPLPVIVSVHGGAWVYGDKDVYQFYCMRLAQRGFAVVNFSYRLAPEAKFPASLVDTDKVFSWIYQNAKEYGFDLNNIFAVGDSAGAHLLALYTSAVTNSNFANDLAGKFNFTLQQNCSLNLQKNLPAKMPVLKGIALNCGKYDMSENIQNDAQMQLLLKALMPQGGTKEELELINAAGHLTKDFPPTFVMTCKGDFLVGQAPVIINALEQAGVKHEYHCYGTQEQPLWHVFHCDPHLPEAIICNDDECNFFKSLIAAE